MSGDGASFSQFRHSAYIAIGDVRLQGAINNAISRFSEHREQAIDQLPAAEALRDHLKVIRSRTLAQLAGHLEAFEQQAVAAGARVHWARDGAEACRIVTAIAKRHGATLAVKSKSMVTEEIHLNKALGAAGVEAIETDLGEYIVQLANEPPSHIIAPAMHKTRAQVAELLGAQVGYDLSSSDIPALTAEARGLLREKFLAAGIGITGGNIGVAETGSIVLVENEGNARLVTSAPAVHVAVVGIEKIAPTWDDAATWLALLARSATGQPLSSYTSIITGPARADDPDGPAEVHIVLLDNGRSRQVGTVYEEVLQCIRCGACLNVCPVYRKVGGHAYASPYSGPIGAVVSPLLFGLEAYEALPHASSLCGACLDVCPVRIDLPRMLLELRKDEVDERIIPWYERLAERAGAFVFGRERLFRFAAGVARRLQWPLARNGKLNVPQALNPLQGRQLPALAPRSFRELWAAGIDEDLSVRPHE